MKQIAIINGPNLHRVGQRETNLYGSVSLPNYLHELAEKYHSQGVELHHSFTNCEGQLIDRIYQAEESGAEAIILNAGAYTHTSLALADCVRAVSIPVIELHISNVFARESVRHHSYLSPHCKALIIGWGIEGYRIAVEALLHTL